jgi:hypothetical protein
LGSRDDNGVAPLTRSRGIAASAVLLAAVLAVYGALAFTALRGGGAGRVIAFPGRVLSVAGSVLLGGNGGPGRPPTSGRHHPRGGEGTRPQHPRGAGGVQYPGAGDPG